MSSVLHICQWKRVTGVGHHEMVM